jgi:hypothetical protein
MLVRQGGIRRPTMKAEAFSSFECTDALALRGHASKFRLVTKRCVAGIVLTVAIAVIGYLVWDRASTPPLVDAEASPAYASFSRTDWESAFRMPR